MLGRLPDEFPLKFWDLNLSLINAGDQRADELDFGADPGRGFLLHVSLRTSLSLE
jgi:hypothetical protein